MKTSASSRSKHTGIHKHRLTRKADNPDERLFHRKWIEQQQFSRTLEDLLGDGLEPAIYVSKRDASVAATVIQWLGSNCGKSFLRDVVQKSKTLKEWLK